MWRVYTCAVELFFFSAWILEPGVNGVNNKTVPGEHVMHFVEKCAVQQVGLSRASDGATFGNQN